MKMFGFEITREKKDAIDLDTLIRRLDAAFETGSGVSVTPETAMQSPTVQALVTGVSRRLSTLPVHVLRKTQNGPRTRKERLPNHPVQKLLEKPNGWQSPNDFILDGTSVLMRYGNFYTFKARGSTGPIRSLDPIHPGQADVEQRDDLSLLYRVTLDSGRYMELEQSQVCHVRGPARNFYKGDSPVMDVREAIALEIAAEKFGSAFFGNGAMPGMVFEFMEGVSGFETDEERRAFQDDFEKAYSQKGRFRALLLPSGMKLGKSLDIANDKAQFLETRRLQRSIIAGAFGAPPHMVGDLERATFSNIEQQSLDIVQTLVLPYARMFEGAMERDLLTPADRAQGVIIRFNLDGALRGDFKSRQEGQQIMRQNGVINANDWRENENMNPRDDEGGEEYWNEGPSGQNSGDGGDGAEPEGATDGQP